MKQDDLDRALSTSREIRPSEGFTDVVMTRARSEAEAPAPLEFPWKRAAPGMAACALLLIVGIVIAVVSDPVYLGPPEWFDPLLVAAKSVAVQWTAFALLVSLVSYRGSMRLAGYRR